MTHFVLGSRSLRKSEAFDTALAHVRRRCIVTMVGTASGVNAQPEGSGNHARCRESRDRGKGRRRRRLLGAWASRTASSSARTAITTSRLPCCSDRTTNGSSRSPARCDSRRRTWTSRAIAAFATHTVGEVIAEVLGGSAIDPHSTVTAGYVSHGQQLIPALVQLLVRAAFPAQECEK